MAEYEVVVKQGPSKGHKVPFGGRRSITIGRSRDNVLVLRDGKVSSRHARLDLTPAGVILVDLGSKNGTLLDGRLVVGSATIEPGNDVCVGNSALGVREAQAPVGVPLGYPASGPEHQSSSTGSEGGSATRTRRHIRAKIETIDSVKGLVLKPATQTGQRNLTKAQRNLAVLHEVGALLSSEQDERSFLARLMDLIFSMLPADRGALLVLDDDGEATPRVTRVRDEEGFPAVHVSRTILSKVVDGGMSILTADAGSDARLSAGQSIIVQNIRSAMCVPIRGKDRTLGAIYVDTVLSIGVFGKDDLHVLTTVGIVAGTALENIQLIRKNLQQARMAAIGQVIAGLGHDIRNMLTALRGGMYLLDEQVRAHDNPDVVAAWEVVQHGHESIASLVQDMVNYSKSREPDWQLGDLNQVVLSAVSIAQEKAREKGVEFSQLVDPTIGPIYFDAHGIERCVMNLLSNAVDAAPAGDGVVSVATHPDNDGRSVVVVVQDNGDGISEEHQEKIWDLLFSTKGSRGTGFGLAITQKIVEEHRGKVLLDSRPGEGAKFTIRLPLLQDRPS
jgi:signal transduction histidine kinase